MQKITILFVLVLLFYRINSESGDVTEENKTTDQDENISENITAANTVQDKPSGSKEEIIPEEETVDENYTDNDNGSTKHHRASRLVVEANRQNLECVLCSGTGMSPRDEACYNGETLDREKCADAEACFTELHPQYIKRGCMLPSSVNRTFVCKCPLCNDKPAGDVTYYDYKTISDWQFDNQRLQEPILGLELLCKVCETTGRSRVADKICNNGSRADYMLCGRNQLCFTNINRQFDYVARGCIEIPVFNSIFFFCNTSVCNSRKYDNPAKIKRTVEVHPIHLKEKSFATTNSFSIQHILIFIQFLELLQNILS